MNFLFYGDNHLASRQALNQAIKTEQGREVIKLDGSKISDTDLRQALESQSLFGQDKLVVIDRLPIKLIDILVQHQGNTSVFIWHDKVLTPAQLKKLSNFKPQLFKIPAVIFTFLDKLDIHSFHQALKTDSTEQIFYMLHRRISQLIQAKDSPQELKLADWQKSRLTHQAKRFTLDQLLTLHSQLLTIDISIKTGRNFLPLDRTLELWLLNL